jgi:hypothetical protein
MSNKAKFTQRSPCVRENFEADDAAHRVDATRHRSGRRAAKSRAACYAIATAFAAAYQAAVAVVAALAAGLPTFAAVTTLATWNATDTLAKYGGGQRKV